MLAIVGAAAACGNAAPIPQVSSVYPNGKEAPPPPPPPTVPLTSAAQSAVDRYRMAINAALSGSADRGIELAFSAIAPMREVLMNGGRNGHNQLETLPAAEFDRLEKELAGVMIGRQEIVFVVTDVDYFVKLAAAQGDATDRAFFTALKATRPAPNWPVYIEQQTDFSGCIRFGSLTLVETYRRWVNFERQFPDRYAAGVRAEIDDVSFQLTESTCACGDRASVDRELGRFVRDFPSAPIRSKVEGRLKALRAGTSPVRANCKSG